MEKKNQCPGMMSLGTDGTCRPLRVEWGNVAWPMPRSSLSGGFARGGEAWVGSFPGEGGEHRPPPPDLVGGFELEDEICSTLYTSHTFGGLSQAFFSFSLITFLRVISCASCFQKVKPMQSVI